MSEGKSSEGFWAGFAKGYLRGCVFVALVGIVWGAGWLLWDKPDVLIAVIGVLLWMGLAFFFVRMKDPTDKGWKP